MLICERWRSNTSITASMSPAASSAASTPWAAPAVNAYQTEFLIWALHPENGSSASVVASTVVPRTLAGSPPSCCGDVRTSFAGGSAAAPAGAVSANMNRSATR